MTTRGKLTFAVAIVLAAVLLWLALRGVEFGRVAHTLRHAHWGFLALAAVAANGVIFLRSERWRILLQSEGPLPIGLVFWATAIGYCGNNFLPARLGELMRTAAISARSRLTSSYVLATALTERLLDAGVLVLASCCALLALGAGPAWMLGTARSMAVLSGAGLAMILLLPRCELVLERVIRALPCGPGWQNRLCGLLQQFLLGMRTFHHLGRALRFLGATGVIWMIDAMSAQLVAQAIAVRLTFPQALLLVAALGLSSALPSTPGSLGIYQFVAVSVLAPFAVAREEALAFILLFQGIIVVSLAVWGAIGSWKLYAGQGLPWRVRPATLEQAPGAAEAMSSPH